MTVRTLIGDVRDKLRELPDESVHCVVCSPPYWGLRDYGVPGQLGLEPTLAEHVETMADVFDEVRRVLRKDGTLWLNYGDSYAANQNGRSATDTKALGNDDRTFRDKPFSTVGPIFCPDGGQVPDNKNRKAWKVGPVFNPVAEKSDRRGDTENFGNLAADHKGRICAGGYLKPKDLCGVPWRVAFALQERGWWLRQDIIWSKPNPMPESIKDRCTKAHEYVFLLSKSERYFFDAEAISEPSARPGDFQVSQKHELGDPRFATRGGLYNGITVGDSRNRRSVWTIATAPYSEAHFATFPPELPELCIKAGTSHKGCCAKCGAPWVRQVECTGHQQAHWAPGTQEKQRALSDGRTSSGGVMETGYVKTYATTGWSPSCSCHAIRVPCTVLDPFGGAGTTALVADRLRRHAIQIELNPAYAELARSRIDDDRGPLLDLMEAP